jgi:hypothetical protein
VTAHPKCFKLADDAINEIFSFKRAVRDGDTQMAGAHKRRAVSLMEWADIFASHPQAAEASYKPEKGGAK